LHNSRKKKKEKKIPKVFLEECSLYPHEWFPSFLQVLVQRPTLMWKLSRPHYWLFSPTLNFLIFDSLHSPSPFHSSLWLLSLHNIQHILLAFLCLPPSIEQSSLEIFLVGTQIIPNKWLNSQSYS
jgi:hypothetical protein